MCSAHILYNEHVNITIAVHRNQNQFTWNQIKHSVLEISGGPVVPDDQKDPGILGLSFQGGVIPLVEHYISLDV